MFGVGNNDDSATNCVVLNHKPFTYYYYYLVNIKVGR